jgi:hypothetical protein
MRRIAIAAVLFASLTAAAHAQPAAEGAPSGDKAPANPCSEQVAASLSKLRNSSWFRMSSNMITENGPSTMEVDYILPDRMHQKVTNTVTQKSSELILVGREAWSRQGDGTWTALPANVAGQLQAQVDESVLKQQKDVGAYTCNGRIKLDGRDVMAYKLESEPEKGQTFKNQTYRMFYVDVMTGLPVSNALLVPGRDDKPIFQTKYTFPLDLKIDPPKDVAPPAPASAAPPASTAPAQTPAPAEGATPDTGK